MTTHDGQRIMAYLAAAYPRVEITAQTVAVYLDGLADQEYADVMQAARDMVQQSRWMPTVSELRDVARERRRYRESAAAVAGAVGLKTLPAHAASAGPEPKAVAQFGNVWRWAAGEISSAEMVREAARIYADEGARPGDGAQVKREAEAIAARLGAGDGPLGQRLRRNVRRLRPDRGTA